MLLVSLCLDVSKWLLTLHNPRIKTQIVIFQQRQIIESVFIPTLTGDPLSLKKCLADIAVILEQCLFLPRYSRRVLQEAGNSVSC